MTKPDPPEHLSRLGDFIRTQRRLAELSQRELAKLTELSDAYVSQIERGLHEPSVRVLRSVGDALNIPSRTLLRYAGMMDGEDEAGEETSEVRTEAAIRADAKLTASQKEALLSVYRSYLRDGS